MKQGRCLGHDPGGDQGSYSSQELVQAPSRSSTCWSPLTACPSRAVMFDPLVIVLAAQHIFKGSQPYRVQGSGDLAGP